MDIAWGDLGLVLGVGLLLGSGVAALYALGIRALATPAASGSSSGTSAGSSSGSSAGRAPAGGMALAGVCFAVCAAAVIYGVYTLL